MKPTTVVIATTIWATAIFGGGTDPFAEERYRAKYGRNTPTAEAWETAKQKTAKAETCLRAHEKAAVEPAPPDAEKRFRAKLGRYSTSEEERIAKQQSEAKPCSGDRCCARTLAKTAEKAPHSDEERFRAKFGRYSPRQEQRLAGERSENQPVLIARAHTACNGPCCKRDR